MSTTPRNRFAVSVERWFTDSDDNGALVPSDKINGVAKWCDGIQNAYDEFDSVNLRNEWSKDRYKNVMFIAKICKISDGHLQDPIAEKSYSFDDYTRDLIHDRMFPDDDYPS